MWWNILLIALVLNVICNPSLCYRLEWDLKSCSLMRRGMLLLSKVMIGEKSHQFTLKEGHELYLGNIIEPIKQLPSNQPYYNSNNHITAVQNTELFCRCATVILFRKSKSLFYLVIVLATQHTLLFKKKFFLKSLMIAAFIWLKYSKNSNIVKYYYNLNYILKCDGKAPVFNVTRSFRNHSKCWFGAQEHFLLSFN